MLFRTLVLCTCLSGTALAADFGSPSPIDPVSDWTGVYVGATLGGANSDGKSRRNAYDGALIDLDVRNGLFPGSIDDRDWSVIGGGTIGYNYQSGAFVGGVEADVSATGIDAVAGFNRRDPNPAPPFNGVQTITGYTTAIDTLATARLRGGYDLGGTLLYGTGGLAFGHVYNAFTLRIPELAYRSPDWSESGTRFGYTVGGGIEQKLTDRLSLKAEALFFDLADTTVYAVDQTNFPGQTISYKFKNTGSLVRAGLNFSF